MIGDNCNFDDDCIMEHSYCYHQQSCECRPNFISNEDQTNCVATVGSPCYSNYDCTSLKSSNCVFDNNEIGYCVCNHGFVSDPHNRECLPIGKFVFAPCILDNQCQEGLGEASFCHRQKCECLPSHHFDGECIRNRGLGESCWNKSQCYIGEEYKNTMDCLSSVCVCNNGYYNYGGYCKTGSGALSLKAQQIIIILILLFFKNLK
ncbi:prion-like-(Q/N-rich) domain-bearing protein 25 isoform X2 [Cimex lectularius]|nr:prion-like-(Q/N-rich) domain-bearing protein 25 isoform X2 [Cimex lectularius]